MLFERTHCLSLMHQLKFYNKCGMERVGEIIDPNDRKIWRWQFKKEIATERR